MKIKSIKTILLRKIFPSAGLLAAVTLAVSPVSCRATPEGIEMLSGDFSVPELNSFRVTSSNSIDLEFSKTVEIKQTELFLSEDNELLGTALCTYEDRKAVLLFPEKTETGQNYILDGYLTDEPGNSLTFSIAFKGFNENPAKVIITELRNAYGTKTSKGIKVHRSEFVELYVLKSGNLSGFEVYSASDGENKKYSFPALEVKRGDYITVHMRTIEAEGIDGEGMVSEIGDDITLSSHEDSCDSARDLWSPNTKYVFSDSDVIIIRDSNSMEIIDALLFAKSECTEWKNGFEEILKDIAGNNIWQGDTSPENAVCSDYITSSAATRSISRQNLQEAVKAFDSGQVIPNTKDDWIIAKKATPGYENSDEIYTKK